jgi:serine protease SohB
VKFLVPARFRKSAPLIPLVRLAGAIGVSTPLRPGLLLNTLNPALEAAFKIKPAKAVAIAVNSPGGSAVQSALIHNRIRQLADKHDKKVLTFAEDVAASGGYMLICAGDEIYADPSSIIGSIGVISASFGFNEAIGKLGVERRLHTSGAHKSMLDPFQPEKPADVKRLKALQKRLHDSFIDLVTRRRGAKLDGERDRLFSGEFWTGAQALEFGLVDGLGGMHDILAEKFGPDYRLKPIAQDRNWLRRRFAGAEALAPLLDGTGPGLGDDLISALETRALWSRYGL